MTEKRRKKNLAAAIRGVLDRRPYWGPQTVAAVLETTPQSVRVVASREGIRFMERYEMEAYFNVLVDKLEQIGGTSGKEERVQQDSEGQVSDPS